LVAGWESESALPQARLWLVGQFAVFRSIGGVPERALRRELLPSPRRPVALKVVPTRDKSARR